MHGARAALADVRSGGTEITCAAFDDGTTTWSSGVAGNPPTVITGTCDAGYYVAAGAPYAGCNITGGFGNIQNPCQRTAALPLSLWARP